MKLLVACSLAVAVAAGCSPKAPASAPPKPCPCRSEGETSAQSPPEPEPDPAAGPPDSAADPDTVLSGRAPPALVTLDHTEIVRLDSAETGRSYELWIALPPSFEKEPERRYPTLYLLDGQWDFSLVRALAGGLLFDQVAPEFLIVGITYGGERPDYGVLRAEDYIPTRATAPGESRPKGGDAKKFLAFIEARVLPLVEERYRADPTGRILSGASFGGLFTLFALFERPDLFETYLALSPAVGWDGREMFQREAAFRRSHPSLERRIWLSVGTDEWPEFTAANRAFFQQFESRRYEGATVRVRQIEGERHAGNKPEAYNRALRFAFEHVAPAAASTGKR